MNNPEFSNICLTNLLKKDAATFLRYIQEPVNHQHVQQWFDGESKTHLGYYSHHASTTDANWKVLAPIPSQVVSMAQSYQKEFQEG